MNMIFTTIHEIHISKNIQLKLYKCAIKILGTKKLCNKNIKATLDKIYECHLLTNVDMWAVVGS